MNCKPGDMAIVKRADGAPEAIGRMVTILARTDDVDDSPAWSVEFQSPVVARHWMTGDPMIGLIAACPDAWLMPISGVPVTDDVTDEVRA